MTDALNAKQPNAETSSRDIGFAMSIVFILCVFFLPIPPFLLDAGLAFSIGLSVLILMVALWIQKPLDFSSFPTVLLVATILRLSLNIATTRLILSNGAEGSTAAGYIISGFSRLVMSGDFVIGLTVFAIIVTVNFLVITKGATRIAEVGARFTLDAIPGKQMAIDADLSAGLIDEREAQIRRRELEEESAFFGSMDGASKFVRGDAIAGLIILAVNIFGGVIIGVTRHGMTLSSAADVYTKLSVGDGLVSQIPALIVSLSAGLLVSKGGTRGSAEQNILRQLGMYPRALFVAALLMFVLALIPGLPLTPFGALGGAMAFVAYLIPKQAEKARLEEKEAQRALERQAQQEMQASARSVLRIPAVELSLGKQLWAGLLPPQGELGHRVLKMRRNFARDYGFMFPDIQFADDLDVKPKHYQIRIHGAIAAAGELRLGHHLIVIGGGAAPDLPGEEAVDPAFGVKALWISDVMIEEAKRQGYSPIDPASVLLTHLAETLRNNLAQMLTYKDMRTLLDRLEPEYKRLLDDMVPNLVTHSTLQGVLKLLLVERVSIRNLELILEAVAEAAPFARRAEPIVEHVRARLAPQICSDLSVDGALGVLRLGARWDLFFHEHLKRDAKGETLGFDADPAQIEKFTHEAGAAIGERLERGEIFIVLTTPDARPYVRLLLSRPFPSQAVLSHLEIAGGVQIKSLGTLS
ncbi:flagellar biosynthesis protein FlhA [Methylocystis parvus]|uniref:Flagellar biosynthesis protein FlhA n=1 Tax=Methylocystis parvus TaxID=134 RepID=A0A6B8M4Y8_9HYPH|nr:flagellar biosynthesis protein FlhA [Methylocystis parvus]QGM98001.1 flagellar biosynthesis protein FlhA [Methylocystis parvus]WBK01683.1 flagellar biosynthesis protein FlhA [Methylocystis parvus OBBP]